MPGERDFTVAKRLDLGLAEETRFHPNQAVRGQQKPGTPRSAYRTFPSMAGRGIALHVVPSDESTACSCGQCLINFPSVRLRNVFGRPTGIAIPWQCSNLNARVLKFAVR